MRHERFFMPCHLFMPISARWRRAAEACRLQRFSIWVNNNTTMRTPALMKLRDFASPTGEVIQHDGLRHYRCVRWRR